MLMVVSPMFGNGRPGLYPVVADLAKQAINVV